MNGHIEVNVYTLLEFAISIFRLIESCRMEQIHLYLEMIPYNTFEPHADCEFCP